MTSTTGVLRWTFSTPTPLGQTRASYEVGDTALQFESDDLLGGGSESVRWDSVREGGTAAMAGMGGRGAPDLARWVPAQIEWLTLSRAGAGDKAFMRALPQGPDRDAIVAAVQARLGSRWIGERLPLQDAKRRLGISSNEWSTLKVAGIVVAVLALLVVLLLLLLVLLHPVFLVPAGFLLGAWAFRRGLSGLRDGIAVANTPTAKARSAAMGLVELEGRAVTAHPSAAAVTGRPCVWWDATVYLWYEDSDRNGNWRQVAARHGGTIDGVDLEDDSGRVPIWLKDADLLLDTRTWESGKDALPAQGIALLDELGFPWTGDQRIRVSEQCLEANATMYVLGTLDERRSLPEPGQEGGLERMTNLLRTGEWRRALVGAVPAPARVVVAVLIGFLDMLTQIGRGGERVKQAAALPAVAPDAAVVWKGRSGHPFLVSSGPEHGALPALRKRSLLLCGVGAAVLCYTLYELVELVL